jgi:hypothetical protein
MSILKTLNLIKSTCELLGIYNDTWNILKVFEKYILLTIVILAIFQGMNLFQKHVRVLKPTL